MTLFNAFIYMFVLVYFCLPEVDLEESQGVPQTPVFPPLHEILRYFLSHALSVDFSLTHKVICILW